MPFLFFLFLGSSMTEFRKMVHDFVESKLGPGDHSQFITNIMDTADVNKDSKVSLLLLNRCFHFFSEIDLPLHSHVQF